MPRVAVLVLVLTSSAAAQMPSTVVWHPTPDPAALYSFVDVRHERESECFECDRYLVAFADVAQAHDYFESLFSPLVVVSPVGPYRHVLRP
jgi:hypothetical protein